MILLQQNWFSFIVEFGKKFGFDEWDWSAVLISIFSIIIAISSYIVARKTLSSQKRTEKNTTPLVDKNIQLFLLNNSLRELYESLVSITALYSSLEVTKYKVYPSKQFWNLVYIDTSIFHEELFYGDEAKFRDFYFLISYVKKFNSDVSDLQDCISNSDVDYKLKQTIMHHICEDIGDLLNLWIKVYLNSLELNKYQMISYIEENFIKCSNCRFNTIYNDDKELIRYYIRNSPFEDEVEKIIDSLDNKLNNLVTSYSINYKLADFKKKVWYDVDLLMLNVLYNGKPFAAHVVKDTANSNSIQLGNHNPEDSSFVELNCDENDKPQERYSWIFYFIDL